MSEVTINQLASDVGIEVDRLLKQLSDAGIAKQSAEDVITEQEKVDLLKAHGDLGKMVLFYNQLPALFEAYNRNAQSQSVDQLLVLNEEEGFTSAVNRGPAAMVDFIQQFEAGFGVNIRELMTG